MFTDHSKSRTLSVKQTVPFDGNLDRLDLTVAALGAVTVRRRRWEGRLVGAGLGLDGGLELRRRFRVQGVERTLSGMYQRW
jgi:hypothetical protein